MSTNIARISHFSMPRLLLGLEGFAIFAAAIAAYIFLQGSALLFVVLLLAPDLSMLGYLISPRAGSMIYNFVHTTLVAGLVCAAALLIGSQTLLLIGLIWLAHIGMDRTVGYGLKYATNAKDTHLGRV